MASRTALITGVSRRAGIGFAIARRFLELELRVMVHGWGAHDVEQPWGGEPLSEVLDALGGPSPQLDHVEGGRAHRPGDHRQRDQSRPGRYGLRDPQQRARVAQMFPSGHWGDPAEVAEVVAWLSSGASAPITGQVIDAESGFRRAPG